MKNILIVIFTITSLNFIDIQKELTAEQIMERVDKNMIANDRIIESRMIIYGKRQKRTVSFRGYSKGEDKSFIEYLAPSREKGTKILKLKEHLWIYSPSSDRTIQLSGHLLRQSVMGSDLSYEDISKNEKYGTIYIPNLLEQSIVGNRKTWCIELKAKNDEVSYPKRKIWIDQERFLPLKEEMFAKSGELLKRITVSEVLKIKDKWYPKITNYKDVLKDGNGTDFVIDSMDLESKISDDIFNKASLKK